MWIYWWHSAKDSRLPIYESAPAPPHFFPNTYKIDLKAIHFVTPAALDKVREGSIYLLFGSWRRV